MQNNSYAEQQNTSTNISWSHFNLEVAIAN